MSQSLESWDYARDIINGKIVASEFVKLSCKRQLEDFDKQDDEDFKWYFDENFADHFLNFSKSVPVLAGKNSGQDLVLEQWEVFFLSQVYGWRSKEDPNVKRYEIILLEVARKNGKTYLCCVMVIYEMLFGEFRSEVYSVATRAEQAKIVFTMVEDTIDLMPRILRQLFHSVFAKITVKRKKSRFKFVGRDSKTQDGFNPSLVVADEAAAITDRNAIEVMLSGMGNRVSPMLIYITTAQFTRETKYYEERTYLKDVLEGRVQDDSIFGMIYALDEGDDFLDESVWLKANPNLNVTVSMKFLRKRVIKSLTIPKNRNEILIKHFNVFTSSAAVWIPPEKWDACKGELKREGDMYLSWDLAQTKDLSAVSRLWVTNEGYTIDFMCFIPRGVFELLPSHFKEIYAQAVRKNCLTVTNGDITDYNQIYNYIEKSVDQYGCEMIGGDPYNAQMLFNKIENDLGLKCHNVRQNITTISPAAKETERIIYSQNIIHDGNPFINWQMGNAEVYKDNNENIKIQKGTDERNKIDGVIAMICAVFLSMSREKRQAPLEIMAI